MRHKYLFGLLIAVVCVCLYLFHVIYSEVREKTIAELNSRQLIHARQAGREIEEYFSDLIIFLTNVSESGHIIELDNQGKKEMGFALKTNREEIKAITRVDERGRILYTLPYDGTVIGKDISYQKHIREIIKTRKPVVSDVFTAVQGYNAIGLHVPVFKGNEYRGTLAFLIDFQVIPKRFLKDIRIGETGYAWMTSRDGIELYCPVPGHTGKSVFENCKDFPTIISMAKEMVRGRQGVTSYLFDRIRDQKIETVKKQAVYAPVKVGDSFWAIVVASSEDEALTSLLNFRNKLIFVVGLLLLCIAVISFYGMRVWGIVREEAKRQKAEDALRESEARYRSLFEINHAAMLLIDPESASIIDANPAACDYYGWSREELKKRRIYEINTLTSEEVTAEMQLARSERRNHFFFKHRLADGTIRDVEVYSGPLTLKGKAMLYSIVHDITERKRTEEALRESEKKYRMVLEANPDPMIVYDIEGVVIYLNPAFTSVFGWSLEERIGKKTGDFVPDENWPETRMMIDMVIAGKNFSGIETRCLTKEGKMIPVSISGSCYWNHEGNIEASVINLRDITERKRAEAEKKKLEEQYRQAQKMEAIGQLAGGVAHDFNNMLSIILGYSQIALMKNKPSDPLKASLQEIMNAARRSADLVRQLMAFARKQTIAPKALDLNDAVAGMLNVLRKLMGEDIDLLWMPAANLWQVKMDPAQVDQILANLAVNARDSISGVGKITIETGKAEFDDSYCAQHAGFIPGQYVLLAVSDNGCGVDKETLEKIFEPFFTTKDFGKGTGMGLATVYGIVKQNNGFINVYSEPGKGTTFKIYLPRRKGEETATDEQSAHAELLTGTETVLLVEDNEALLKMGKMMLEELGYAVLTAGSPNEAIKLAEQYAGDIHLVLTDVVMPEMSGRGLQRRLSALWPDLKFLFMSGYTANVIAHRGFLDEGVHFLQKPFQMEELATKAREALERS